MLFMGIIAITVTVRKLLAGNLAYISMNSLLVNNDCFDWKLITLK